MAVITAHKNECIQEALKNNKPFQYLEDVIKTCELPMEPVFMDVVNHVLDNYNFHRAIGIDKYKAKIMAMQDGLTRIYFISKDYEFYNER